jgi:AraC-like DNA-binding protein
MSKKRQPAVYAPAGDPRAEIATLSQEYPAGRVLPPHFHDRDQLVYASRGVMTVRTGDGMWVVPTHRAVWIPAAVPHSISMSGVVAMRTLYVRRGLARALPRTCCVLNVSPLLRELILHACSRRALSRTDPRQRHLIQVILDQFVDIGLVPLQLPTPSDPRARRAATILLGEPSDRRPLIQICRDTGASKRTLERLFQHDVGMTFGKWRQQLRLLEALRLLADGAKVSHAALESGYSTPSAFASMFRKALGTTPSQYFGTARAPDSVRAGRASGPG